MKFAAAFGPFLIDLSLSCLSLVIAPLPLPRLPSRSPWEVYVKRDACEVYEECRDPFT